jgi:hypothetical protein
MSRPTVFAEQFQDQTVATALREHREDRAALLRSLTASFQADLRVRAAWLWGSFGRNEADDLSDLDPWLIVADEYVAEMGSSLRLYAEQTGSFLWGGEAPHNAPPGGGYFGALHEGRHGLLHVDCYWQPRSAVTTVPEHAVLFDGLHEPAGPIPASYPSPSTIGIGGEVESGLRFAWLMFSIAAKYLARDPDSDMSLMFYPKEGLEKAIVLLGKAEVLLPLDWSVPETPLGKVARLRGLVESASQATAVANAQGLPLPSRYGLCLFRYLDMVEGILGYYIFAR